MIVIDDSALDLIAGGRSMFTNSATVTYHSGYEEMPVVIIPGERETWEPVWPTSPADNGPWESDFPPHDGGGGGGGSDSPGAVVYGPRHSTPAPDIAPTTVHIDNLRNTVLHQAEHIKTLDKRVEHGILIVADTNGLIRIGPLAIGNADKNTAEISLLSGEKIVGWLHSHPALEKVDERFPSSPGSNPNNALESDTYQLSQLMKSPHADPGLQMYILDNATGKVFEYAGNGPIERKQLGANISDDIVKP